MPLVLEFGDAVLDSGVQFVLEGCLFFPHRFACLEFIYPLREFRVAYGLSNPVFEVSSL